jgi:hypothetical protein
VASAGSAERFLDLRWTFLERLMVRKPETAVFRKGWSRRIAALRVEVRRGAVGRTIQWVDSLVAYRKAA